MASHRFCSAGSDHRADQAAESVVWSVFSHSLLTGIAAASALYWNVHRPIFQLVRAVQRIKGGDYAYRLPKKSNNEFAFLMQNFNEMATQIQDLIENVLQSRILARDATLKQLQAQIHPHFLYRWGRRIADIYPDRAAAVAAGSGDSRTVPDADVLERLVPEPGIYFRQSHHIGTILSHKMMVNIQYLSSNPNAMAEITRAGGMVNFPSETVRMAMVVVGVGPIVFAYPFFQKYFIKGLTVGSVKG
nr:HAMP domain-containing protein [Paenibacillus sp. P32E]